MEVGDIGSAVDNLGSNVITGFLCSVPLAGWSQEIERFIDFDAAEVDAASLGTIVENRAITNALLQRLEQAGDVTLLAPASLAGSEIDRNRYGPLLFRARCEQERDYNDQPYSVHYIPRRIFREPPR